MVFDELEEVSSITIFVDEVIVLFGFEFLKVLDDVGGSADGGQNFDLVADAFLQFLVLQELLDGNYFHRVQFLVQLVLCLVDGAETALADQL